MAYTFPRAGTFASSLMSDHVHECLRDWRKLPTRTEAKTQAQNFFASTKMGATGLYTMTLLGDDSIAMCFYGIRGGFKVIWNFGKAEEQVAA